MKDVEKCFKCDERRVQIEICSTKILPMSFGLKINYSCQSLERFERKRQETDNRPKNRLNQILSLITTAVLNRVISCKVISEIVRLCSR